MVITRKGTAPAQTYTIWAPSALRAPRLVMKVYPLLHHLHQKTALVLSREVRDGEGRLVSDAESNSEWETEDESRQEEVSNNEDTSKQSEPEEEIYEDVELHENELSEVNKLSKVTKK